MANFIKVYFSYEFNLGCLIFCYLLTDTGFCLLQRIDFVIRSISANNNFEEYFIFIFYELLEMLLITMD